VNDWCDCTGVEALCQEAGPNGCPNFQNRSTAGGDPDLAHASGVRINRTTVALALDVKVILTPPCVFH
jgi:hypothetical protein